MGDNPLPFYNDYELYSQNDGPSVASSQPNCTGILALPTSSLSAYMESFTPNFNEMSYDTFDFQSNTFSFNDVAGSIDIDGGSLSFHEAPTENLGNSNKDCYESPQIAAFWERYNQYPQYLKKIKKRNRQKAKKMTSKAPQKANKQE